MSHEYLKADFGGITFTPTEVKFKSPPPASYFDWDACRYYGSDDQTNWTEIDKKEFFEAMGWEF